MMGRLCQTDMANDMGNADAAPSRCYLHGFGSDGAQFRTHWPDDADGSFLDGPEPDLLTGRRRWFAFTASHDLLAERIHSAAMLVEQRLVEAGATDVHLVGHSQGAMVCLEIVRAGRLAVRRVDAFAAFLPSALLLRPRDGTPDCAVRIWSSTADRAISVADTATTVLALAAHRGLRVRHYVSDSLTHEFCSDWLDRSRFREVGVMP